MNVCGGQRNEKIGVYSLLNTSEGGEWNGNNGTRGDSEMHVAQHVLRLRGGGKGGLDMNTRSAHPW